MLFCVSGFFLDFSFPALYLNPHDDCKITSVKEPDLDVFSKTDLDALNAAWKIYCKEKKAIVDFTHRFPEWLRRWDDLKEKKSVPMNMLDFLRTLRKVRSTARRIRNG